MASGQGGSGGNAAPRRDWLARTPMWARIVVPLALLAVAALIVVAVLSTRGRPEPEAVMREQCASAAESLLEGRGATDIEVAASAMQVTETSDGYRVQGTASFEQDGAGHHTDLRCILRAEGDGWRIASVRVSP